MDTRLANLQELANSNASVDHRLVLGVPCSATEKEIKTAFKRLSLIHHPDKVTAMERQGAETIFKILSEAQRVMTSSSGTNMRRRERRYPTSTGEA